MKKTIKRKCKHLWFPVAQEGVFIIKYPYCEGGGGAGGSNVFEHDQKVLVICQHCLEKRQV